MVKHAKKGIKAFAGKRGLFATAIALTLAAVFTLTSIIGELPLGVFAGKGKQANGAEIRTAQAIEGVGDNATDSGDNADKPTKAEALARFAGVSGTSAEAGTSTETGIELSDDTCSSLWRVG